jgi:predicted acetyltransferase
MGLAGVAISPTHRRRGLAQRMLTAGFEHARERGDCGSALFPFRASFYEDLGYGLAGEAHQYQLPPSLLPDDKAERLKVRLVDTDEDLEAMKAVYAEAARLHQTGQLDRTDRSWKGSWGDDAHAGVVYWNDDGVPEGYCIVRYRADLPLDRRYLEVEERAWLTIPAQRGIYAWLSTLGDQWREITYRAHPEEGFGDRIKEPRLPLLQAPSWKLWFPSATLLRGPMFRVLDVAEALHNRTLATEAELTLKLEVEDAQIPENRGPWKVRMEGGAFRVEPYIGGRVDASLTMPIQTLSRIFIGALAPWQALSGGLATLDGSDVVKMLDRAFEVPKPWTFDKF